MICAVFSKFVIRVVAGFYDLQICRAEIGAVKCENALATKSCRKKKINY